MRCTFETDLVRLAERAAAWQRLAERALEPNPFFEPWFLLPALRHLPEVNANAHAGAGAGVLFIEEEQPASQDAAKLTAVVPLRFEAVRVAGKVRLPLHRVRLLTHDFSFCHTPLVDPDPATAARALAALLDWCRARRAPILELDDIYAEGRVRALLLEEAARRKLPTFERATYERAVFLPRADASAYLAAAMAPRRRRDIERRERQLRAAGRVECLEAGPAGNTAVDVTPFLRRFLALEGAGWKGEAGTAFDSTPATRDFFLAAITAGYAQGRVWFQTVELDGATIASLLSFVAGGSSYSWKICYDERLSRFSPGVYVEVLNLRRLHERPGISWMDSGARPDHPMVNRLWPDRKRLESRWIATGGVLPSALVRALPLATRLKARLDRVRRRGADADAGAGAAANARPGDGPDPDTTEPGASATLAATVTVKSESK